MIVWMASACLGWCGDERRARQRRMSLKRLARQTALLIFVRAAEMLGRHCYDRTPRVFGVKPGRGGILRAVVGVKLRRALRHRHPFARMGLLIRALTDLDANARLLMRRLRYGLTRARAGAPARAPQAPLPAHPASAFIAVDSS